MNSLVVVAVILVVASVLAQQQVLGSYHSHSTMSPSSHYTLRVHSAYPEGMCFVDA